MAIVLEGGELPVIEAMQGWFVDEDGPRRVLAVEKGPAEVVVVRDPAAQPFLDLLARDLLVRERQAQEQRRGGAQRRSAKRLDRVGELEWGPQILQLDEDAFIEAGRELFGTSRGTPSDKELAALREGLRGRCRLGDEVRLSFVSPQAAPVSRTVEQTNVFNLSTSFEAQGFLSFVNAVPSMRFVLRVADAAWLFGRELYAIGHRRGVVVLIVATSLDESLYSPESVRETLEKIQVPVFVWSFGSGPLTNVWDGRLIGESPDSIAVERDLALFEEACRELRETLEAQRIVWLEGPPDDFSLSGDAVGIRLAGDRPAPEVKMRRPR